MDQNQLFSVAMGLTSPWKITHSVFNSDDSGAKSLRVDIDLEPGSKMACPSCGKLCPLYDRQVKQWRHLNFWQHSTYLRAPVPRVQCSEHGVLQAVIPWARPGSGFTLLFEAYVLALARDMPVSAVAEMVGENDTRLWRVVRHYVDAAHAAVDWSQVDTVAVDETSTRRGHRYATVVVDLDVRDEKPARLLFMTQDRTAQSVAEFVEHMPAHGAEAKQVRLVAIDMSAAYQKGAAEHLPGAEVVFDRFHVMKLAGEAVDEVRKSLHRQGHDMRGALWALRGNVEGLKKEHRELRERLCKEHKALGRAMALRESLAECWNWPGPASAEIHLQSWCSWARRSRLKPFTQLAKTLQRHWQGILAYYPHRITSAAIEAINGIIQTARRRARGFRNFENLRAISYWMAGRLNLNDVHKIPT